MSILDKALGTHGSGQKKKKNTFVEVDKVNVTVTTGMNDVEQAGPWKRLW
jgi:hypothetical protein